MSNIKALKHDKIVSIASHVLRNLSYDTKKKSTIAIHYEDEEEDVESSDSDYIVLQDLSDEDSRGPDEDISDHDSSDLADEPLRKEVQLKSGRVATTCMAL